MFKKIKRFFYVKFAQYSLKKLRKLDADCKKLYEGYGMIVDNQTMSYLIQQHKKEEKRRCKQ